MRRIFFFRGNTVWEHWRIFFFGFSDMNLYYRAQLGLLGSLDPWAFQESQDNKALEGCREREDQVAKRSISSMNYYFLIITLKCVH